jgi:hypothetical protein
MNRHEHPPDILQVKHDIVRNGTRPTKVPHDDGRSFNRGQHRSEKDLGLKNEAVHNVASGTIETSLTRSTV